jgi:hypothetical protein
MPCLQLFLFWLCLVKWVESKFQRDNTFCLNLQLGSIHTHIVEKKAKMGRAEKGCRRECKCVYESCALKTHNLSELEFADLLGRKGF